MVLLRAWAQEAKIHEVSGSRSLKIARAMSGAIISLQLLAASSDDLTAVCDTVGTIADALADTVGIIADALTKGYIISRFLATRAGYGA